MKSWKCHTFKEFAEWIYGLWTYGYMDVWMYVYMDVCVKIYGYMDT